MATEIVALDNDINIDHDVNTDVETRIETLRAALDTTFFDFLNKSLNQNQRTELVDSATANLEKIHEEIHKLSNDLSMKNVDLTGSFVTVLDTIRQMYAHVNENNRPGELKKLIATIDAITNMLKQSKKTTTSASSSSSSSSSTLSTRIGGAVTTGIDTVTTLATKVGNTAYNNFNRLLGRSTKLVTGGKLSDKHAKEYTELVRSGTVMIDLMLQIGSLKAPSDERVADTKTLVGRTQLIDGLDGMLFNFSTTLTSIIYTLETTANPIFSLQQKHSLLLVVAIDATVRKCHSLLTGLRMEMIRANSSNPNYRTRDELHQHLHSAHVLIRHALASLTHILYVDPKTRHDLLLGSTDQKVVYSNHLDILADINHSLESLANAAYSMLSVDAAKLSESDAVGWMKTLNDAFSDVHKAWNAISSSKCVIDHGRNGLTDLANKQEIARTRIAVTCSVIVEQITDLEVVLQDLEQQETSIESILATSIRSDMIDRVKRWNDFFESQVGATILPTLDMAYSLKTPMKNVDQISARWKATSASVQMGHTLSRAILASTSTPDDDHKVILSSLTGSNSSNKTETTARDFVNLSALRPGAVAKPKVAGEKLPGDAMINVYKVFHIHAVNIVSAAITSHAEFREYLKHDPVTRAFADILGENALESAKRALKLEDNTSEAWAKLWTEIIGNNKKPDALIVYIDGLLYSFTRLAVELASAKNASGATTSVLERVDFMRASLSDAMWRICGTLFVMDKKAQRHDAVNGESLSANFCRYVLVISRSMIWHEMTRSSFNAKGKTTIPDEFHTIALADLVATADQKHMTMQAISMFTRMQSQILKNIADPLAISCWPMRFEIDQISRYLTGKNAAADAVQKVYGHKFSAWYSRSAYVYSALLPMLNLCTDRYASKNQVSNLHDVLSAASNLIHAFTLALSDLSIQNTAFGTTKAVADALHNSVHDMAVRHAEMVIVSKIEVYATSVPEVRKNVQDSLVKIAAALQSSLSTSLYVGLGSSSTDRVLYDSITCGVAVITALSRSKVWTGTQQPDMTILIDSNDEFSYAMLPGCMRHTDVTTKSTKPKPKTRIPMVRAPPLATKGIFGGLASNVIGATKTLKQKLSQQDATNQLRSTIGGGNMRGFDSQTITNLAEGNRTIARQRMKRSGLSGPYAAEENARINADTERQLVRARKIKANEVVNTVTQQQYAAKQAAAAAQVAQVNARREREAAIKNLQGVKQENARGSGGSLGDITKRALEQNEKQFQVQSARASSSSAAAANRNDTVAGFDPLKTSGFGTHTMNGYQPRRGPIFNDYGNDYDDNDDDDVHHSVDDDDEDIPLELAIQRWREASAKLDPPTKVHAPAKVQAQPQVHATSTPPPPPQQPTEKVADQQPSSIHDTQIEVEELSHHPHKIDTPSVRRSSQPVSSIPHPPPPPPLDPIYRQSVIGAVTSAMRAVGHKVLHPFGASTTSAPPPPPPPPMSGLNATPSSAEIAHQSLFDAIRGGAKLKSANISDESARLTDSHQDALAEAIANPKLRSTSQRPMHKPKHFVEPGALVAHRFSLRKVTPKQTDNSGSNLSALTDEMNELTAKLYARAKAMTPNDEEENDEHQDSHDWSTGGIRKSIFSRTSESLFDGRPFESVHISANQFADITSVNEVLFELARMNKTQSLILADFVVPELALLIDMNGLFTVFKTASLTRFEIIGTEWYANDSDNHSTRSVISTLLTALIDSNTLLELLHMPFVEDYSSDYIHCLAQNGAYLANGIILSDQTTMYEETALAKALFFYQIDERPSAIPFETIFGEIQYVANNTGRFVVPKGLSLSNKRTSLFINIANPKNLDLKGDVIMADDTVFVHVSKYLTSVSIYGSGLRLTGISNILQMSTVRDDSEQWDLQITNSTLVCPPTATTSKNLTTLYLDDVKFTKSSAMVFWKACLENNKTLTRLEIRNSSICDETEVNALAALLATCTRLTGLICINVEVSGTERSFNPLRLLNGFTALPETIIIRCKQTSFSGNLNLTRYPGSAHACRHLTFAVGEETCAAGVYETNTRVLKHYLSDEFTNLRSLELQGRVFDAIEIFEAMAPSPLYSVNLGVKETTLTTCDKGSLIGAIYARPTLTAVAFTAHLSSQMVPKSVLDIGKQLSQLVGDMRDGSFIDDTIYSDYSPRHPSLALLSVNTFIASAEDVVTRTRPSLTSGHRVNSIGKTIHHDHTEHDQADMFVVQPNLEHALNESGFYNDMLDESVRELNSHTVVKHRTVYEHDESYVYAYTAYGRGHYDAR